MSEAAAKRQSVERTDRDVRALRLMTEQYGFRLDELSVLLKQGGAGGDPPLSIWGVRQQVKRWKRAGWVRTEVRSGRLG